MKQQYIILVTAYGEDNYYQKQYEDIVGMYTTVNKALNGAMKDGMTNRQKEVFFKTGGWASLYFALQEGKYHQAIQIDYEEETDKRRKPCTSSYMFQVYRLDN